jgi:hypothetical protein
MTDKPDNQMERWLEEYARRRQGELGVPLDMHEATRTMLQNEVSRKYGQPAQKAPEPSGIPWLGWAFGGAAIGAVALIISINPGQPAASKPLEVAKADPKPETGNVVRDEGEQQDGGRFKMAEAKQAKENSGLARSNPRGPESGATTSGHRAPGSPGIANVQALPGVAPTGPAGFAIPGRNVGRPKVVQLPAAYYNGMRDLRQEFSQTEVIAAARKNTLPKPVLVTFQIERNGNQIRVVDKDGSIYEGTVINEEEFAAAADAEGKTESTDKLNETAGLAGAAPPSAPAITIQKVKVIPIRVPRGQFYFRVSGTNKTLRKRVVIEATFDNPVAKRVAVKAKAGENGQSKNRPQVGGAAKKDLKNRNIQAVRAIARMRVLGNARIEKSNYRIDAYQRARALPTAPIPAKPTEAKEK